LSLFDANEDLANLEIDEETFNIAFEDPKFDSFLRLLEIDRAKAREEHLFSFIDKDCSGTIAVHELISSCIRLTGPASAFEMARLYRDFTIEKEASRCFRAKLEKALRLDKLGPDDKGSFRRTSKVHLTLTPERDEGAMASVDWDRQGSLDRQSTPQ